MTPDWFCGKTVLVTGGTRGIGRAIALDLARRGARPVVTWHRDASAADATERDLAEIGGPAPVVVRAALERANAAKELAQHVRREVGAVHLLVSNAGFGPARPLVEVRPRDWDMTMRANAHALLELVQHLPALEAVVAISSIGARRVRPDYGAVAVAKAAQEALVRQLALEHAPRTRVNAVSPGLVDTSSSRSTVRGESVIFEETLARTPVGRLAEPDDVAKAVRFLLSPDAAMITGQTLVVDGGYEIQA